MDRHDSGAVPFVDYADVRCSVIVAMTIRDRCSRRRRPILIAGGGREVVQDSELSGVGGIKPEQHSRPS